LIGCIQFLLKIVGFEILGVLFVPLCAFPPVPLPFALRICAGHLAIFQPGIGHKPPSANPAGSFLITTCSSHLSLSFVSGSENDFNAFQKKEHISSIFEIRCEKYGRVTN
jgi:hypothetical protein